MHVENVQGGSLEILLIVIGLSLLTHFIGISTEDFIKYLELFAPAAVNATFSGDAPLEVLRVVTVGENNGPSLAAQLVTSQDASQTAAQNASGAALQTAQPVTSQDASQQTAAQNASGAALQTAQPVTSQDATGTGGMGNKTKSAISPVGPWLTGVVTHQGSPYLFPALITLAVLWFASVAFSNINTTVANQQAELLKTFYNLSTAVTEQQTQLLKNVQNLATAIVEQQKEVVKGLNDRATALEREHSDLTSSFLTAVQSQNSVATGERNLIAEKLAASVATLLSTMQAQDAARDQAYKTLIDDQAALIRSGYRGSQPSLQTAVPGTANEAQGRGKARQNATLPPP